MENFFEHALGEDASQLAAEERQRLLSRLLSRVAHEVRNPLSSLDIHVQLLEEDLNALPPPRPPKIADRLEIIRTELRRLDSIVRQFLSLAGPSSIDLQPANIADVLQHVCRLFEPEAAAREIALTMTVAEGLPKMWMDAGQLTQALVNLVINAMQAIEHKGRVAICATLNEPQPGVCIEVRDTGPGFDPKKRLTDFEPFYTTKADGSGLGLWIVQQIAAAHGGGVAAANSPSGGAIVTIRLPLRHWEPSP